LVNDDVNDAEENEDDAEIPVAKQQQRWCCMLLEYFYV
tara:strand:+ start:965 stop:1078 length:114 start_codon:yes stop_codon:yes gene_type:complete